MRILLLGILFVFLVEALADPIYKWTDSNGLTHYSEEAPEPNEYDMVTIRDIKAKKLSANTTPRKNEEIGALQQLLDTSQSEIISWGIDEESEGDMYLKINYFYDGIFNDTQLWISASAVEPGKFSPYSVRPAKVFKGYNNAIVYLSASSKADKIFCTSKLRFSIYGKFDGSRSKTFLKSLVDHNKCWKRTKRLVPKTSTPVHLQ